MHLSEWSWLDGGLWPVGCSRTWPSRGGLGEHGCLPVKLFGLELGWWLALPVPLKSPPGSRWAVGRPWAGQGPGFSSQLWGFVLWTLLPSCRRGFPGSHGLRRQGRAGLWLLINEAASLAGVCDQRCDFLSWELSRVCDLSPGRGVGACFASLSSLQGPLRARLSFVPSRNGI